MSGYTFLCSASPPNQNAKICILGPTSCSPLGKSNGTVIFGSNSIVLWYLWYFY